jgi:folylpolyglutamate synthase/dihydrofolate synthase
VTGTLQRLGGISAAIAGIMCLRMANQWKKDFGSYSTQAAGLGFAPLSQMDDEPAPPRSKTVKTGIHLGLESMETLMSFLAPMKIPHVHIAGTNGKGSVSAMLDSCLREAGMRTGRYNSPHLVTIRDAIVINGKDVSMSIYQKHRNKIDDIIRNNSLENSEFEITTAIAFSVFAEMEPKLDILIIECGMGGLRDATNVLNKSYQLCSVLTAVDLDHQGFLGDTVGAIAREKLGINVEDGLLVVGKQDHAQVMDETIHKVRDSGIELYKADEKPAVVSGSLRDAGPRVIRVNLPGVYDTPESDLDVSLPLAGEHQKDNLATSLTTLQVLRSHRRSLSLLPKLRDLNEQSFKRGISRTIWKGRCSWIQVAYPPPTIGSVSPSIRQVDVLVDGAHNASAASHLRSYVESLHTAPMTPITYIIGLSHSPPKTPASVLHPLLEGCRSVDKVIAVAFSTPIEGMPWIRPVPVDEVRKAAVEAGIWPENVITLTPENGELPGPTLLQALQTLDPRSDGPVIVTGSLYLVADAYRLVV